MNRKPRAVPILLLCSCMLVLGGCNKEDKNKADNDKSSEETKAINEGEYSALLPFSVSDAGQKHAQMQTNLSDTLTIGTGLMELSKEYFSSKTYAFRVENIWITIHWMPPRITADCWGERARKMQTV